MSFNLDNKIPPPIVMLILASFAYAIDTWNLFATGWQLPWNTQVPWLLAGLALVIDISALISFRRARTTVNPMKVSTASNMVTSGIYRMSRNPMYLGLLLWFLAWIYWLANPLSLLLCVVFVWYINRFQIAPEEKALQNLFGEPYQQYLRDVRRWI